MLLSNNTLLTNMCASNQSTGTSTNYINNYDHVSQHIGLYPQTPNNSFQLPTLVSLIETQQQDLFNSIRNLYLSIIKTVCEIEGMFLTTLIEKEKFLGDVLLSALFKSADFNISEQRKFLQYLLSIYEEISDEVQENHTISIEVREEDVQAFRRKQAILNRLNNHGKQSHEHDWYVFHPMVVSKLFVKIEDLVSVTKYLLAGEKGQLNIGIGLLKTLK